MRRRLLSNRGLEIFNNWTFDIKKNIEHSLSGNVRLKISKTIDGLSTTSTTLESTISNPNTATATVVYRKEDILEKLNDIGVKKGDTIYIQLEYTNNNQGVIVPTLGNPNLYLTLSNTGSYAGGTFYNARVTASISGTPIGYKGGTVTITITHSYTAFTTNYTASWISGSKPSAIASTCTKTTVTLTASSNNTSGATIRSVPFTISATTSSTPSASIVTPSLTIIQDMPAGKYTLTGWVVDDDANSHYRGVTVSDGSYGTLVYSYMHNNGTWEWLSSDDPNESTSNPTNNQLSIIHKLYIDINASTDYKLNEWTLTIWFDSSNSKVKNNIIASTDKASIRYNTLFSSAMTENTQEFLTGLLGATSGGSCVFGYGLDAFGISLSQSNNQFIIKGTGDKTIPFYLGYHGYCLSFMGSYINFRLESEGGNTYTLKYTVIKR